MHTRQLHSPRESSNLPLGNSFSSPLCPVVRGIPKHDFHLASLHRRLLLLFSFTCRVMCMCELWHGIESLTAFFPHSHVKPIAIIFLMRVCRLFSAAHSCLTSTRILSPPRSFPCNNFPPQRHKCYKIIEIRFRSNRVPVEFDKGRMKLLIDRSDHIIPLGIWSIYIRYQSESEARKKAHYIHHKLFAELSLNVYEIPQATKC